MPALGGDLGGVTLLGSTRLDALCINISCARTIYIQIRNHDEWGRSSRSSPAPPLTCFPFLSARGLSSLTGGWLPLSPPRQSVPPAAPRRHASCLFTCNSQQAE